MAETKVVPTNKAELLAYTDERWTRFVGFIDALSDEQWEGPTDAAGWNVKDHVAHVALWDRAEVVMLRHGTPMREALGLSDLAWSDKSFFLTNEEIREQTVGDPPKAVRQERDRVYGELIAVISGFSEADLARPATEFGFEDAGQPLLQLLTEYHGDHFEEHRGYIEIIVRGVGVGS